MSILAMRLFTVPSFLPSPEMASTAPSPSLYSQLRNVKSGRTVSLCPVSESASPNFMRKLSSSQRQQLRAAGLCAAEINLGLEGMT